MTEKELDKELDKAKKELIDKIMQVRNPKDFVDLIKDYNTSEHLSKELALTKEDIKRSIKHLTHSKEDIKHMDYLEETIKDFSDMLTLKEIASLKNPTDNDVKDIKKRNDRKVEDFIDKNYKGYFDEMDKHQKESDVYQAYDKYDARDKVPGHGPIEDMRLIKHDDAKRDVKDRMRKDYASKLGIKKSEYDAFHSLKREGKDLKDLVKDYKEAKTLFEKEYGEDSATEKKKVESFNNAFKSWVNKVDPKYY